MAITETAMASEARSAADEMTCTLSEAIAWFTYQDEGMAARYGAPLHAPDAHSRRQRQHDLLYIANIIGSSLPGTDALIQLSGEKQVEAFEKWGSDDAKAWKEGANSLLRSIRNGEVRSYRNGNVAPDFWMDRTLEWREAQCYRFDRKDLRRLIRGFDENETKKSVAEAPARAQDGAAAGTAAPYRSGLQGRPTCKPLLARELKRRREAGEVLSTMSAEARHLAAWVRRAYPEAAQATAKTIQNSLRPELREAVNEAKARK
jgi:hypothetical protein